MTNEIITIFDIESNVEKEKKAGGTYKVTIIRGKNQSGKGVEYNVLQNIVDSSPDMLKAVSTLTMGSTATLVLETKPNSKFPNVVGIYEGVVQEATSQVQSKGYAKKEWSKSSGYDNLGQQIGNAINNAVLLLCNKVEKGGVADIERIAGEIMRISDRLRKNHNASATTASQPQATTKFDNAFVDDDSIPFD